jgi:hypothetical protein
MFELTATEWDALRCNFGTLKNDGRGQHPKYLPFAFTEQGVAMLSGLLNSKIAIEMNIKIMRAFVLIRQYALGYAELNSKLEEFMRTADMQFSDIYQALAELAEQKRIATRPRRMIGYGRENEIIY